jgi:hypothetical protein
VSTLDELRKNSRNFYIRTGIMILISLVLTLFGTFYFSYDNPIINTTAGNIQALALLALIAINMGWYFRDITKVERERKRLIAQLQHPALAADAQGQLDDPAFNERPALNSGDNASTEGHTVQQTPGASAANG